MRAWLSIYVSNHLVDGEWTVWLCDSVPVTIFSFSGPEGKDRTLPPLRSIQSIWPSLRFMAQWSLILTYRLERGSGSQGESQDCPWMPAVIWGYLKATSWRNICRSIWVLFWNISRLKKHQVWGVVMGTVLIHAHFIVAGSESLFQYVYYLSGFKLTCYQR